MNNTPKNQPLTPDLVQQRQELADALGFLLAQAWLREHRQSDIADGEGPSTNGEAKHPP